MLKSILIIMMFLLSKICLAAEESPDMAFLEWLGQTAEMEELGMDINQLIQNQEQQNSNTDTGESSQ